MPGGPTSRAAPGGSTLTGGGSSTDLGGSASTATVAALVTGDDPAHPPLSSARGSGESLAPAASRGRPRRRARRSAARCQSAPGSTGRASELLASWRERWPMEDQEGIEVEVEVGLVVHFVEHRRGWADARGCWRRR